MALPPHDFRDISTRILSEGWLDVVERTVEAPRSTGGSVVYSREIIRRFDAAAVIIHDKERDVVVLARQFRMPVYDRGDDPFIIEPAAGKVDEGESPEQCARREAFEELGYELEALEHIASYWATPGYSTERLHLYYSAVTRAQLKNAAASGLDADEDIERVEIPLAAFFAALDQGEFGDAKLLICAQWLRRRLGR